MLIVRICFHPVPAVSVRTSQETIRAMIVCNCFNVREKDLAELATEGRCCLKSVRQATGLGTNCGKCIPQARAVITAHAVSGLIPQPEFAGTMGIRL
jgi:bacterioferritin-associated ferredoxin